jgi:hypothetical protein
MSFTPVVSRVGTRQTEGQSPVGGFNSLAPAERSKRHNFQSRVAARVLRRPSVLIWPDFGMELKMGRNLRKRFGVAARVTGDSGSMSRSEQYRRFARECMEMAGMFMSERARAPLVHMAQVWLRLADEKKVDENVEAADES